MSTLIIGACFLVALIALLALVFVIRSGARLQLQVASESVSATTPTHIETPKTPAPTQESTSQAVSAPESTDEHHTYVLNGQFHELSLGLHALREQLQEMERRLSTLTTMIEDVEHSQDEKTLA
ncbi:MAG TPA: hypothetical protein DHW02_11290 [Ktedonobacter sp.]|nr:hypothetical protein [Ktedonobacter sp.]